MPRSKPAVLLALLFLALLGQSDGFFSAPSGPPVKLQKYTSRFYTVYTNLSLDDARPFFQHMDATFAAYKKMFAAYHARDKEDFPLYLFDTKEHYSDFLASQGINAAFTGGIFFVNLPKTKGLATFTQGSKPGEHPDRSWTFHTLQHEGFHQFAYAYIGTSLPLWVNEGLAEYFGNGILVGDQLFLGCSPSSYIESVRDALRNNTALDFDKLIAMTSPEWRKAMIERPDHGALLYQQSWSIVHFLIHGDAGKYAVPFDRYLKAISAGKESGSAFREAFGSNDTAPFRARWENYVLHVLQPDPMSTAVSNLQFLGMGLQTIAPLLAEKKLPMPRTTAELERYLKQGRFSVTRSLHGMVTRLTADDDSLYKYNPLNRALTPFIMLDPSPYGTLPRITAPGMVPEPTLVWRRESDGQYVLDIDFKT